MKRGSLIVVEGMDRTGKSTQCKKLVENLQKKQIKAEYMNFPNRQTEIGKVINSYLTSKKELPDESIHLLFSANRWECEDKIINSLQDGTTLVVDRYCYSGVAFSAAKGLNINWCKSSDIGLPKPDKVFFLTMPFDVVQKRGGFGEERYEIAEFQKKVSDIYNQLKEDNWDILNADRSVEDLQDELLMKSVKLVDIVSALPIGKLWI